MSGREIARNWFIPAEGIDRHVISADIQRYLGNDATVRPGPGTGEHEGAPGYWIKAYRNLTSAMIADLRASSARWSQEQRQTGTREPYVGSSAYQASGAGRPQRRDGDSPSLDGPYGLPSSTRDRERDRVPPSRIPASERMSDRMDIDPPQPERRYQQDRVYPDGRAYPSDPRDPRLDPRDPRDLRDPRDIRDPRDVRDPRDLRDPRAYPSDGRQYPVQPDPSAYGQRPVTSSYGVDPRYATAGYGQANDGAPPGYVRQGQYYVPISAAYEQPVVAPSRFEPPQSGNGPYGQPSMPQGRPDARSDPRDPRYGGQSEFSDPRYAYPSPAATVSSITAREREPISPPQQSYGSMPVQYDQYNRPIQVPPGQQSRAGALPSRDAYPPGVREPVYPPGAREQAYSSSTREPTYPAGAREPSSSSHSRPSTHSGRDPRDPRDRGDRPPGSSSANDDSHSSRRRRLQ